MTVVNVIRLDNVLPEVFADSESSGSDVWLRDVTFERGRRYLISAASGAGKSSLCSFLIGHRRDYSGTIRFDDRDTRRLSFGGWTALRRNSLSLVWQDLRLFPELTAVQNVRIKNRLTHFRDSTTIETWFHRLAIADKCDTPVARLSYGQQQRVAFMRALCQPADFIILDEPVSHLDDDNAAVMAQLLTEEAQHLGAAIIVTSIGKHLPMDYDKVMYL